MADLSDCCQQALAAFAAGLPERALDLLRAHPADRDGQRLLRDWALIERDDRAFAAAQAALSTQGEPEAHLAAAINAVRHGKPEVACQMLQPLLVAGPDDPVLHLHCGRAEHNRQPGPEALAHFERASQLAPNYFPAWYALAHARRALGQISAALEAYRRALQGHPQSVPIRFNLGLTLLGADRHDEALVEFDHLLAGQPGFADARAHRGLALHALGRFEDAAEAYTAALASQPENPLFHFYFGCLENERMNSAAAEQHLQRSVAADPQNPDAWLELAGLAEQTNRLSEAASHVRRGLQLAPAHPGLQLEAARLERRLGKQDLALRRMRGIDAAHLPARQAQTYWFEYGWAADREGDATAAMQAFAQAHRFAARSPRRNSIDPAGFPRRLEALHAWLEAGAPGGDSRFPADQPAPFRPAFLIGFPRSGTTLLDTLLDAQASVHSIEEHPTLEHAEQLLRQHGVLYPSALAELDAELAAAARQVYYRAANAYLPAGQTECVLDKLPLRLLLAPLIRALFPTAPILFSLRHPCDVILSCYMQQFAPTEAFIHFDTLEDSVSTYVAVMSLWRRLSESLQLDVTYVRYESLVSQPGSTLEALGDVLGLAIDPQRIDPEQRLASRARIRTNSYQQVAEPIYRRAVDRWQRYRPWLEPHLERIAPLADWLGYEL